MKKSRIIATLAALGLATTVYAGNGMGCGACDHQGQGMQHHKGKCAMHGKSMGQNNRGGEGNRMKKNGMGMMDGMGMKGRKMAYGNEGNMQRGMHGPKMKMGKHNQMKEIMAQLDLGDTQRQKIREIRREGRQAMKQNRMGHKPAMDFSQFMTKEHFDKEAFKKVMQQKWEAKDKMRESRRQERMAMMSDRMEKVFEVLTPEQREKLVELRK